MAVVHFSVLPLEALETLNLQHPDDASRHVFLRLPHPRTGHLSLFLAVSTTGSAKASSLLLEVQTVAPPSPRSWFHDQQVVSDGSLLIMTPIDIIFLLIGLLNGAQVSKTFRTLQDIFDALADELTSPHSGTPGPGPTQSAPSLEPRHVLSLASLPFVEDGMRCVCDVKALDEETFVYRFSHLKSLAYLRAKVDRLCDAAVVDSSRTLTRALTKEGLMDDGKEDLMDAGRRETACDLVGQYLSDEMKTALTSFYDFVALTAHRNAIKEVDAALAAQRAPLTTSKSKTNPRDAKDGEGGKKRKAVGKAASQGVEKLKKANINGMAKLSSFFSKSNNATPNP